MNPDVTSKLTELRTRLGALESAIVAFSGGVDSTFVLYVAHEVLGERCLALTTISPTTPATIPMTVGRRVTDVLAKRVVSLLTVLALQRVVQNVIP